MNSKNFMFGFVSIILILSVLGIASLLFSNKSDSKLNEFSPDQRAVKSERPLGEVTLSKSLPSDSSDNGPVEDKTPSATAAAERKAYDWHRAHPAFLEFHRLDSKAVMSANDRLEYEKLLSSPTLIQTGYDVLNGEDEKTFTQDRVFQRMLVVDYFHQSLKWKENPARQEIEERLLAVLDKDLDGLSHSQDLKRTFVGDRLEILEALYLDDPGYFTMLRAKLQNPKAKQIYESFQEGVKSRAQAAYKEFAQKHKLKK